MCQLADCRLIHASKVSHVGMLIPDVSIAARCGLLQASMQGPGPYSNRSFGLRVKASAELKHDSSCACAIHYWKGAEALQTQPEVQLAHRGT